MLPPLGIPHHHHRPRWRIYKLHHVAQLNALDVPYHQPYQVSLVILTLSRRRHLCALHLDHRARQNRCGIAVFNSL
jgi:hypothetical protein